MNKITKFFKKKKCIKEYKQYLKQHQENIMKAYEEMINCPALEWIIQDPLIKGKLFLRAINHDISVYDKEEFNAYRAYYYSIDDKEEEWAASGPLDKAWEHHFKVNDHHWQHRQYDTDFTTETELACLENILDWLAMGYEFGERPFEYWDAHKEVIHLPKKQIEFMDKCIYQGIDAEYIEALKEDQIKPKWAYKMSIQNYDFYIPLGEEDLKHVNVPQE